MTNTPARTRTDTAPPARPASAEVVIVGVLEAAAVHPARATKRRVLHLRGLTITD